MHAPAFDNESPQPAPGPLNGIRVLDTSMVYAAPITAMLLVTTALMFSRSSISAGRGTRPGFTATARTGTTCGGR